MTYYSWRTRKTQAGFEARVFECTSHAKPLPSGSYVSSKLIFCKLVATRAQATGLAKRTVRRLKRSAVTA
jgi:hypothetical protein